MNHNAHDKKENTCTELILAGVSGTGKSTLGALLSQELHWPFADSDIFHSRQAIGKMTSNPPEPLDDEYRSDWFKYVVGGMIFAGIWYRGVIVANSALKKDLRRRFVDAGSQWIGTGQTYIVWLAPPKDPAVLKKRVKDRHEVGLHGFPPELVDDQLGSAEWPDSNEKHVRVVETDGKSEQQIIDEIIKRVPGLKNHVTRPLSS